MDQQRRQAEVDQDARDVVAGGDQGAGYARHLFLFSDDATTETAVRTRVLPLLSELRRRGLRADMDYGGRSQKGQLGQAGKLNAGWTVIVDGGEATVREPGRDDWTAALDELVDRISG